MNEIYYIIGIIAIFIFVLLYKEYDKWKDKKKENKKKL